MPEELLAMIIVMSILTFLFTVIKSTQNYKLKRYEHEAGGRTEDSLTTTELRDMIADAVEEATSSMRGDIDAIAARLEALDGGDSGRISLEADEPVPEKTVGRQTRERQR